MNIKNDVEVIINGKQYTLCGYESNEYLQRIASHINEKYAEFKMQDGYNRLDVGMRNILLAINLSDDYFKAQKQADELQLQKEELEKEIFDMKHELLSLKSDLEEAKKQLEEFKEAKDQADRQIIRLEAELEKEKKNEPEEEDSGSEEEQKPAQTSYKSSNKRSKNRKTGA